MSSLGERLNNLLPERRQYSLLNMAHHLYEAGQRDQLYQLIDQPWRNAHFEYSGTHHSFALDVLLAIRAAAERFPSDLPEAWRGIFLFATLREVTTGISPQILRLLAQLGREQQALNYAALIQDAFQLCVSYVYIGEVFLVQNQVEAARMVVRKALGAALTEEPIVSRAAALALTAGLAARVHEEEVLSLALDQLESGSLGNLMTGDQSRLLEDLTTARHREALRRILHMTIHVPEDNDNSNGIATDVLAALAPHFARLEMKAELNALRQEAEKLPEESDRTQTLATIVGQLARIGDRVGVKRIASVAHGQPSPEWRAHLLGAVACAYHDLGEIRQARSIMKEALEAGKGFRDKALYIDLARMGRYDEAVQMTAAILKPQSRSAALRFIASIALEHGDGEQATAIAEEALDAAKLLDEEDIYALHGPVEAVVDAAALLWNTGGHEEAHLAIASMLDLPDELCDPTYGPHALTVIMDVLASAGDSTRMERALAVAVNLEDSTFRDQALDTGVEALVKMGRFDRAIEVVEQYEAAGLSVIADGFLQQGERHRAEELVNRVLSEAETIRTGDRESSAFNAIARELAAKGRNEEARQAALEALNAARTMAATSMTAYLIVNGEKALALGRVAVTLSRIGDETAREVALAAWEEANPLEKRVRSSLSREAWESSVGIWGERDRVLIEMARVLTPRGEWRTCLELAQQWVSHRYAAVASTVVEELLAIGQKEAAVKVAADTLQLVRQAGENAGGAPSLAQTVSLYLKLENYPTAFAVAKSITDDTVQASALVSIAGVADPTTALSAAQHALRITAKMSASAEKVQILCDVANALSRFNPTPEAATAADRAYQTVLNLREDPERITEMARCAAMLVQTGDLQNATLAAETALSLASLHQQRIGTAWTLLTRAWSSLDMTNGLNRALSGAKTLTAESARISALEGVVKALVQTRDVIGLQCAIEDLQACASDTRRTRALADAACALYDVGQLQAALRLWQETCLAARDSGRNDLFMVLEKGAPILAQFDETQMLWRACAKTIAVSNWWPRRSEE